MALLLRLNYGQDLMMRCLLPLTKQEITAPLNLISYPTKFIAIFIHPSVPISYSYNDLEFEQELKEKHDIIFLFIDNMPIVNRLSLYELPQHIWLIIDNKPIQCIDFHDLHIVPTISEIGGKTAAVVNIRGYLLFPKSIDFQHSTKIQLQLWDKYINWDIEKINKMINVS